MASVPDSASNQAALALEEWAEVVRQDLTIARDGLVAAGRHLLEAKAQHHGEFTEWVNSGALGVGLRQVEYLMSIAKTMGELDSHTCANLPSDYSTLRELARLDAPQLKQAIEAGDVTPGMDRVTAGLVVNRLVSRRRKDSKSNASKPKALGVRTASTAPPAEPQGGEAGVSERFLKMCAGWLVQAAQANQARDLAEAIDDFVEQEQLGRAAVADLLGEVAQELRGS